MEVTYHFKPGAVNITISERFRLNLLVSLCVLVAPPSHFRVFSRTLLAHEDIAKECKYKQMHQVGNSRFANQK